MLPSKLTDGSAYFCIDTGELYIDFVDESNILYRKKINSDSLADVSSRVSILEDWHMDFTEVSEEEINALFT